MAESKIQQPEELLPEPEPVIATAPETPEAVAPVENEVARLTEALEAAEAQAAQNLAGWQRAQALYENYRKRTEAERVEWTANANVILLARLLPVLDDFERAFTNLPAALQDEPWINGVRLIEQKLRHILALEGVEPIAVHPGDLFDPYYHEAVLHQEMPGFAEGQIIAEVQRGCRQGERLVRPAQVVVAKAAAQAEPAQTA